MSANSLARVRFGLVGGVDLGGCGSCGCSSHSHRSRDICSCIHHRRPLSCRRLECAPLSCRLPSCRPPSCCPLSCSLLLGARGSDARSSGGQIQIAGAADALDALALDTRLLANAEAAELWLVEAVQALAAVVATARSTPAAGNVALALLREWIWDSSVDCLVVQRNVLGAHRRLARSRQSEHRSRGTPT